MNDPRTTTLATLVIALACGAPPPPIDLGPYPQALDLTASRLPVLVRTATGHLDFGDGATRGHLLDGWSRDEQLEDGTTFVWGLGSSSTLRFEVLELADLVLTARVWPYREPGGPRQEITFELNGERLGTRRLKPGLRPLEILLPAESQLLGENRLVLRYGWHRPAAGATDSPPTEARALAVAWDELTLGKKRPTPGIEPGSIHLPYGTEISFFFSPPAQSVLTVADLEATDRRGRLRVRSQSEGRPEQDRGVLAGDRSTVLLEVTPGQLTRVTLAAEHGGDSARSGGFTLRSPELRSSLPFVAPPATPQPAAQAPSISEVSRPNVIFYLVDTLRADHLGCYGYPRPTSPEIDAFAADAVLFERTMAQSSWTRTGVASVLTGAAPRAHGVVGRDDALAEEAVTLAEILAGIGYSTAAFHTNGNVGEPFGFAQGFSRFELLRGRIEGSIHAPATAVNTAAFDWLQEAPREPFFLYLHTMEPHAPYQPAEPARSQLAAGVETPMMPESARAALREIGLLNNDHPPVLGSVHWLQALHNDILLPSAEATEAMIALYDAEIRANDRAFGQLIDRLRALGLYQRTLIIFLSDHGEEFHDHGAWSHGRTLYQEQLEIALIARFPGPDAPRGLRVEGLATQLDLVPTVTDLLGLERPPQASGRSLQQVMLNRAKQPGYALLDLDGRRAKSVIEGRWKLTCDPCRLNDLTVDPGEARDLSAENPVRFGYLKALMSRFEDPASATQAAPATVDPELLRQLEALGYVGAGQ